MGMSLVLKFYNSIDNENLQFKDLVKKLYIVLFMTLGAHRKQALFTITVYKIVVQENNSVSSKQNLKTHNYLYTIRTTYLPQINCK